MTNTQRITRTLVDHFFRRFFDNDTIQVEGDTLTTVVRAVSVVAVPGLMFAFFLQNQYPSRSGWGAIEDQYFFVLFSFVVMGAVSIFEWQMLFPDRLDFLILSPLSLHSRQMLAAKAAALFGFLTLFLVGCNLFGTIMLPIVSQGHFLRQVYAHAVAVSLAGIFAALLSLALGAVLLCVLSAAQFRIASPLVQIVSVMALILLMLHYARYGDEMQTLLSEPLGRARWMPPLWFLGVYERLLHGASAPKFAPQMARYAVRATLTAAAAVLVLYPLAWARMRRIVLEGASQGRRRSSHQLAGVVHRIARRIVHRIVRRPGERAAFHFIGQTIARNNRYQVYLAMYCGVGLALAVACAVTFRVDTTGIHPILSDRGLHAIMPLLLFWAVAGLRTAFASPLNLSAGWVFRITGVSTGACADAARRWALWCAIAVTACIVAVLRMARWDLRHLLVQAVCGLCLCLLLTDGFFFFQQTVPFNQPRMPGKTNLPLILTLYIGVLAPSIVGVIALETLLEMSLAKLLLLGAATLASHLALTALPQGSEEIEEEMEGYEGEFQLLGLS